MLYLNDKTTNNNTLTNVNGVSEISESAFAASLKSGGFISTSSQYFSVVNAASLRPTIFTIEAWVKTSSLNNQIIFSSFSANTSLAGFFLWINSSGKLVLRSGKNSGTTQNTDWKDCVGATSINDGLWHHVAGVSDGTNLTVFVDGVQDAQVAWANNPVYAVTNYVNIGAKKDAGTMDSPFTGYIDDIRLWNTNRSSTQIKQNMTRALVGNESNLQAYWPLEQVASTAWTLNDKTSNYNDLINQLVDKSYDVPISSSNVSASFSEASSAFLRAVDNSSLKPTSAFTIEAWVKPTASQIGAGKYPKIFQSYSNFGTVGGILLFIDGDVSGGSYRLLSGKNTGSTVNTDYKLVTGPVAIADVWTHIAVTYDGANLTMYINGSQYSQVSWANNPGYNSPNFVQVGAGSDTGPKGSFWDGLIDEVRLWNVARTGTQINQAKDRVVQGNESGLVAYWSFDNIISSFGSFLLNFV